MKINLKILLGFLGGSVVLVLILSVVFYNDLFKILANQHLVQEEQSISLIKDAIERNLEEAESEIKFINKLSGVIDYLERPTDADADILKSSIVEDLSNFIEEHKMYSSIIFINENGQELIKVSQNKVPVDLKNIKDTHYFKETFKLNADQIFVSLTNINSNTLTLQYSVPVFNKAKEKKGILEMDMVADMIFEGIRPENITDSAIFTDKKNVISTYLINQDGYYLHNPNSKKEWGLLQLNKDTVQNDFPNIASRIFSSDAGQFFDVQDNYFVTFRRITPFADSVTAFHMGKNEHEMVDAKPYTIANNEKLFWTLFTLTSRDQILNRVNILFYKTISLVFLILIFFIVSMMWFLKKIITDPIEKLREGAERIKKGNLDYELEIGDKKDEIGELASEFNSMASVLREYKSTMETQVAKRTADLEKFKMAVENTFDYVTITDQEGTILYANKSTERITGYTRREVVGNKIGATALWGGLMSTEYYENMWNSIKVEKQPFLGEIKNKRKTGEEYNALLSITPILDKQKNVLFYVSIERDITSVTKGYY